MNKTIWDENSSFYNLYGEGRSLQVKTQFIINIPFFFQLVTVLEQNLFSKQRIM